MPSTFFSILKDFSARPTLLADSDVTHFRDVVCDRFEDRITVPEVGKNNPKASKLRQEGNRFYQGKKFEEALKKYNESICFAETGSEQLAIGYANRSAVYYETDEYEFALYNIALARKNHCPERLMPKLLDRELRCKEKIATKTVPGSQLQIVKDPNPRIPFLAKGVGVKEFPKIGRGLVAEKDFEAGDIILDEKPLLASVVHSARHSYCGHCTKELHLSLIPCPNCVFYMYCSEACLEEDRKFAHRFECGVATKLANLSNDMSFAGARFFFHGLTLFGDNVQQMMKYCKITFGAGGNPFAVDYTKCDALAEFKELHKARIAHRHEEKHCCLNQLVSRMTTAILYNIYTKTSLVKSIVSTSAQKDFMLRAILHYTLSMKQQSLHAHRKRFVTVCPFGSLLNHSCDPNAATMMYSGRVKLILLRPVRKGEHICASYGPTWWESDDTKSKLNFTCACDACKLQKREQWWRMIEKEVPTAMLRDFQLFKDICHTENFNNAARLNAMKQFIQRYAYLHPERSFAAVLELFHSMLAALDKQELIRIERAEVVDGIL